MFSSTCQHHIQYYYFDHHRRRHPKLLQLLPRVESEPTTCRSQVQHSTRCAFVPPRLVVVKLLAHPLFTHNERKNRDKQRERDYTQEISFDMFTTANFHQLAPNLNITLIHIHTDQWAQHHIQKTTSSNTLDIGMIKLRWKVSMTLVNRTMNTMYAAFSKSVS